MLMHCVLFVHDKVFYFFLFFMLITKLEGYPVSTDAALTVSNGFHRDL